MATIRFFTRTITKDKNALVPIYVRLKYGRKIDLVCKADLLVKPESWSNETQQTRQRAEVFKYQYGNQELQGRQNFNARVNGLRKAIENALIEAHREDITAEWLRITIDKHWHPEKYEVSLFRFIEEFIEKAKTKPNPKTGRPVSYKMRREYEVSFKYLKDFAAQENKSINFDDIDLDFYDRYVQFLQESTTPSKKGKGKKLAVNTIGKKIQTLKIFLNAAKDEGLHSNDKFKSKKFVALTEDSEAIALTEAELNKLAALDLRDRPALDNVRDLFLVGCWTGCRFSDISQITPDNISGGFIRIRQQKTGNKVVIPLHPTVTALINKHEGALPIPVSNQKFNLELKKIAQMAKLNEITHKAMTRGGVRVSKAFQKWELVTTHCARRSFATNLYKSDFPSISIMAITGHKTEEAFLKYIKVTPEEHAKKLREHWDTKHLKVV
jgi:integrase